MKLETKVFITKIAVAISILIVCFIGANVMWSQPPVLATVLKPNQVPPASSVSVKQKIDLLTFVSGSSSFTLSTIPQAGTIPEFVRNGVVQTPGVDYTITGNIINLITPSLWATDDVVNCRYFF